MRTTRMLAVLLGATMPLAAQGRPAGPPPGMGGPEMMPAQQRPPMATRGAQFLLAHTGELELTDAQVVRLAAVARRSEARHKAMRAAMDSARNRFSGPPTAGDSAARRQFRDRMRTDMERLMEAARTDQRDAIAVLNADQQSRAWEMVSRGGGARGAGMMNRMRGQRMGGGRQMRRMQPFMRDGQPPREMPAPGMRERRPMRQPPIQ